jgi:16S rRNA (uracil1498-N3)-methyltransferase
MRIPRVYTVQPLAEGRSVELDTGPSKHLLMVLRLNPGASLALFDGSGREFEAILETTDNRRARVRIGTARTSGSESPLRITLAQGISRGERMDFTLQKAAELGIEEIIPVLTERSVVRLDGRQAARKQQHWQQLVIGACEQSGRVRVPAVQAPLALRDLLSDRPQTAGLDLLLHPEASASLNGLAAPGQNPIRLLVGPEGGLSEAETAAAQLAGFTAVRLGPRVLRTETAALVALSLLQARWGDLV